MRSSAVLAFSASLLTADALNLLRRTDGSAPRVVQHEIRKRHVSDPVANDRARLAKRTGTINVDLDNAETLYYMDVDVGTPAQSMKLHIDTGSSDLWVNVPSSSECSTGACNSYGTFTPKDSSTYTYLNSDFNITYEDGSGASGDYATDTVSFSNVTIDKQEIGIGYVSTSAQGLIGIGYRTNEASVEYESGRTYANVPVSLVNNGDINVNAYSLWLNDLDANEGSILFGGINTKKYTGSLETVPIIPLGNNDYAEFIVALTGVGADGKNGSIASNIAVPALLDSGTSLLYLPNQIAEAIYDSLDAQYDAEAGEAFVDCSLASNDGTIDFTFSSPTISVALSQLVLVDGEEDGQEVCILGIGKAGDGADDISILGDTFLRSAYVVYDLDDNTISLAQTDFNSDGDDILEITSSGVPDATTVQNAVTSVQAISAGANIASQTITSSAAAAKATGMPWNGVLAAGAVGVGAMLAL